MKKFKDYNLRNKLLFLMAAFIMCTFSVNTLQAQLSNSNQAVSVHPSALFGAGLGINDYGLGGGLEIPIANKLSFFGNLGVGGWGWKIGGGLSVYPKELIYKSSISLGFSIASGLKDFETEMELAGGNQQKIILDLNKVSTVNLIYSYNLKVGQLSKFVFSAGYAIPITSNPYEIKTQGVTLSATSEQVLEMLEPGGLILGIKFMIGI